MCGETGWLLYIPPEAYLIGLFKVQFHWLKLAYWMARIGDRWLANYWEHLNSSPKPSQHIPKHHTSDCNYIYSIFASFNIDKIISNCSLLIYSYQGNFKDFRHDRLSTKKIQCQYQVVNVKSTCRWHDFEVTYFFTMCKRDRCASFIITHCDVAWYIVEFLWSCSAAFSRSSGRELLPTGLCKWCQTIVQWWSICGHSLCWTPSLRILTPSKPFLQASLKW